MLRRGFADESKVGDVRGVVTLIALPALARKGQRLFRLGDGRHFHNGHMRHIGPLFTAVEGPQVQVLVQLPKTMGLAFHPQKHRGRSGNEGFDVAHPYLKSFYGFQLLAQHANGFFFRALQITGRKHGDMGRQVSVLGIEFPAQVFDEMSDRVSDVRDHRVLRRPGGLSHGDTKIIVRKVLRRLFFASEYQERSSNHAMPHVPEPEIIPPGRSFTSSSSSALRGMNNENLDQLARVLDDIFQIPGTQIRFGLDAIIGLIPGVGDLVTGAASFLIIFSAWERGLPRVTLARMVANVAIDTLVGSMPILGDLFDAAWKANRKNYNLLLRAEQHPQRKATVEDWAFLGLMLLAIAGLVAVPILIIIVVYRLLAAG